MAVKYVKISGSNTAEHVIVPKSTKSSSSFNSISFTNTSAINQNVRLSLKEVVSSSDVHHTIFDLDFPPKATLIYDEDSIRNIDMVRFDLVVTLSNTDNSYNLDVIVN
tara:strand:+ start:334 stop:657 length:324 start_codon:yes stop_codon:yes gene_type:complete